MAAENIPASVSATLEKLRAQCLKRGDTGILGLGQAFELWDKDNTGTLDLEEFTVGLQKFGVQTGEPEVR